MKIEEMRAIGKAVRECARDGDCVKCRYYATGDNDCINRIMRDAADTISELLKRKHDEERRRAREDKRQPAAGA